VSVNELSTYDIMNCSQLVISESAIEVIENTLKRTVK